MRCAAAALVLLAAPAAAQDAAATLEACLAGEAAESCIGSLAAPCIEAAGGAAAAVAACYDAETAVWQARLDAALTALRDDAAASDAMADAGAVAAGAGTEEPASAGAAATGDGAAPATPDASSPRETTAAGGGEAVPSAAPPAAVPPAAAQPAAGPAPTDPAGQGGPAASRPSRAAALARAQAAWLAWRDADCEWHAMGFDPQAAVAARGECRMLRTADRVLALEPRGQAVDGP